LVVRVKVAVKEVKAPVVGNREGIALPIDTVIEGVAVTIEGVAVTIEGVVAIIEGVVVTIEGVTAVIEGIAEVLLVAVAVAEVMV
jgi:hypothetical protein